MLLAMVVHLLLPPSQLKQYARLVIGLLLILVILQPILTLFKIDIPSMAEQLLTIDDQLSEEDQIEMQLDHQKNEIEQIQAAYILEEMVVQMQYVAEEELKDVYAYQIEDLQVTWNNPQRMEDYKPESIAVVLTTHEESTPMVNEVKIEIGDTPQQAESAPDDHAEVRKFLAEKWGVEEAAIILTWKEE
ncbi:stage III sporulation protein AF [Gracilibacillus alcaliphilus]